jgi:hypothetical protein
MEKDEAAQNFFVFTRTEWGGIRTDNEGRVALKSTASVLAFMAAEQAAESARLENAVDDRRNGVVRLARAKERCAEDWLAICRVQEMVTSMQAREAEQRELDECEGELHD